MSAPAAKSESPAVRHVEVDETREGQRLDNFLLAVLKGVPKSRVYRCLRKGEVRVNKGRVGPEYRLQVGDVVRIPPIRMSSETPPKPRAGGFDWLGKHVLYEDEHLLILDKPSGMAVHAGSGVITGLIEALRAWRPQAPMLELVHRLDRETSGCLLIAKSRAVLTHLHAQLRAGEVSKHYAALVRGAFRHARTVEASLERRERGGERMVEASAEGKAAASHFEPVRQYGCATLVDIELLTGRTHQARVHAAHIGHPIAGDEKYGGREFNRDMSGLGLRRLFLHAARLEFRHPMRSGRLIAEAPLPDDLSAVLEKLAPAS
jgi:23S rRNA pseudouridine955/2504/2580 synthase